MKTLKEVEISAYIKQCALEGVKRKRRDLAQKEIETAEKRNGRYFDEMIKGLNVENIKDILKNKKRQYKFTDDGALLLEEVFCLWYLKNHKIENYSTQKDIEKQIFDYEQTDVFVDQKYLNVLEDMSKGNEMVIKVIECFYKLLLDTGLSMEDVDDIMKSAAIRNRYAERKAYNEVLKTFNKCIGCLNKVHEETKTNLLSGTEVAMWMDYATEMF